MLLSCSHQGWTPYGQDDRLGSRQPARMSNCQNVCIHVTCGSRGAMDQNMFFVDRLNRISQSTATAVMLCTTIVLSAISATAQDTQLQSTQAAAIPFRMADECAPLFKNSVGRVIDASFSAHDYSEKNLGKVGISIFPGQDLGKNSPESLGTALVNSLRKRGVDAECFIHYEYGAKGTGIDFKIRGLSWGKDKPLQISEALNADTINAVAAEVQIGNLLLDNNNSSSLSLDTK